MRLATPAGLEPATCRLEGGCSIQLSYGVRCGIAQVVISHDKFYLRFSILQSFLKVKYSVGANGSIGQGDLI